MRAPWMLSSVWRNGWRRQACRLRRHLPSLKTYPLWTRVLISRAGAPHFFQNLHSCRAFRTVSWSMVWRRLLRWPWQDSRRNRSQRSEGRDQGSEIRSQRSDARWAKPRIADFRALISDFWFTEPVERKREGMSQGSKTPGTSRRTEHGWENATDKPSFVAARSRKRQLLAELCADSEDNQPVQPEDLLARWPTNPGNDPDVASLLFEDFRQRRRRGEKPSLGEYDERFPEHKDSV